MDEVDLYLFDTNAIIEAVRTGTWNAISGGLRIETVEECKRECLPPGQHLSSGHVTVSEPELSRLHSIHAVSETQRATLLLALPAVAGLDDGEKDLYAHAYDLTADSWLVCSPDIAAVKVGVSLGWADRLVSLEEVNRAVGARPNPELRRHFTASWLSGERTKALLGM